MMNTIKESELADFIKNEAVKKLHIVQNENGNYEIFVTLTWKGGNWNLITSRGIPREWVSLDRLARHIVEKYDGILPRINLTLTK